MMSDQQMDVPAQYLLLDSGATTHIVPPTLSLFIENRWQIAPCAITLADGKSFHATETCNIVFNTKEKNKIRLTEVIISEKVACGIISIGRITERGGKVHLDAIGATIVNNGVTLAFALRNGRSFLIPIYPTSAERVNCVTDTDIMSLHITLGHANAHKIRDTVKQDAFSDLSIESIKGVIKSCPVCIATKMKKSTQQEARSNPPDSVLDLLQVDYAGPYKPWVEISSDSSLGRIQIPCIRMGGNA